MIFTVKPAAQLKGTIQLPSSKSYSIRSFIIAACGGESKIFHPSDCDDAVVARKVAQALGAEVVSLKNNTWKVVAGKRNKPSLKINVKESGTVLRFLLPLVALRGENVVVTGEGTLCGRPNHFLTRSLRRMGADIRGKGSKESVPIRISRGSLNGGMLAIDGTLSSQFISALLIACPQLCEDTCLVLKGKKLVSLDYITMTLQVLRRSGIKIQSQEARTFRIKGKQKYKGLRNFKVPSDYGLAAFLMAAAALTQSNVTLRGYLKKNLIQADDQVLLLFKRMGIEFQKTAQSIHIQGPFVIKGGNFSLKNCPDLLPIMAVLALFAKGKTRLYNIAHARVKESDRISDLRKELLKIGAKVAEKRNELVIEPIANYKTNCLLDPHHDHRLAMAFSVLGLKLGVRVKDIECSKKSYPGFVRDFKSLRLKGNIR